MSTAKHNFLGYSQYKMDPKYRVSIPSAWRPATGETLYLLSSKTHDLAVIKVLSQEAFDHRVKTIEESNLTHAEKSGLRGTLSMLCREASVNDQGKLLVPKELSEEAGLAAEAEVVLVGRGMHFEVWNKENHASALSIERAMSNNHGLDVL